MFHRIYPKPFTRINEAWNPFGKLPSNLAESYCDPIISGNPNSHWKNKVDTDFYNKIGVDIVTETAFDYPTPMLGEKFMRPILYKRMFIIVGPTGTLSLLQQHGYKTFAPFINEDYDAITDPHKRMTAIVTEIHRLCNIPIDELKKTMLTYKDSLEYNYTHLKSQKNRDVENVKKLLGVTV
jgi:hypothetical protein